MVGGMLVRWAMIFTAEAALDDVLLAHVHAATEAVVQVHLVAKGATGLRGRGTCHCSHPPDVFLARL